MAVSNESPPVGTWWLRHGPLPERGIRRARRNGEICRARASAISPYTYCVSQEASNPARLPGFLASGCTAAVGLPFLKNPPKASPAIQHGDAVPHVPIAPPSSFVATTTDGLVGIPSWKS